jgi:hypothetical protein
MKRVVASIVSYDSAIGRIEPGKEYLVDDDKAARWIENGIAGAAEDKPANGQPQSQPAVGLDDDGDDDTPADPDDQRTDEELTAEARRLHDAGGSERSIAQALGVPRTRVHSMLAG